MSREPHAQMLAWHRQLLALRKGELAGLGDDLQNMRTRFDETARWLVVERSAISIACNFGGSTQPLPLRSGAWRILLTSESGIAVGEDGVTLPSDSVAVVKHEQS
jgi:maltooligosyltrehalose trehalohydrolase